MATKELFRWFLTFMIMLSFLMMKVEKSAASPNNPQSLSQLTIFPEAITISQPSSWVSSQVLTLTNTRTGPFNYLIGEEGMPTGTVQMLHLDEPAASTTFQDSSLNGNNGTCSGSACPSSGLDGVFGKSVQFDGEDDVIQTSTSGFPTGNSDRTMAAWFKVNEFIHLGRSAFLMGYGTFGTYNQVYALLISGSTLYFSQWGQAIFGPDLQTGRWYHVAVTNTGNFVIIYLITGHIFSPTC